MSVNHFFLAFKHHIANGSCILDESPDTMSESYWVAAKLEQVFCVYNFQFNLKYAGCFAVERLANLGEVYLHPTKLETCSLFDSLRCHF